MITIKEAVIVEGRYDKIRLESLIDALIIPTNGFQIFSDEKKLALLRKLAAQRGLLILTDSDHAGFLIRNRIASMLPAHQIKHAYIPDIYGKERRKDTPSSEGKLGVEGMPTDVLVRIIEQSGAVAGESREENADPISRADFFEDGLIGAPDSTKRRRQLLKALELPENMSANALLSVINSVTDRENYYRIVACIYGENENSEED